VDISQNPFHNPKVKLRDEFFKPTWIMIGQHHTTVRVNETGGNRSGLTGYRSNWSGPVTVWAGIKPAPIQNLNLNSKK